VEYQPIVAVASGAVVGFEALLRWLHPQRGRLAPADFLPIAEETGLAAPIGLWVLRKACRQARAWHAMRPGQEAPTLAVNLSSRHCAHPELAAQVEDVLEETGFDARRLRLEISEGAVVDRSDVALGAVSRLREHGVRFDIDDFGTGGSSLAHLHRFPASALKMGQPFVERLGDAEGPCVGQTILAIANGLGLEVIAEGVETPAQLVALRTLGCELAQGHLLSPPLTADRAEALLASASTLPAPTN
jgi:EAL domain-containing protein (putative c-di-GMP-specific phosphodiesterase class I)